MKLHRFDFDDTVDDDVPATFGVKESDAARVRRFCRDPCARYGPIIYRAHVLVGSVTGTLEIWRLDPTTKTP